MSDPRRHRPVTLGCLGLLAGLTLVTGCTQGPATPPPTPTGTASTQPVETALTLHPGSSAQETIVAHVLARHLTHRGAPAEVGEATAEPWQRVTGEGAAVVDTLGMMARLAPDEAAGPVPSPTADPSPEPDASPSADEPTASPDAAGPTADAEATESVAPKPVPGGEAAPDAGAVARWAREQLPEGVELLAESSATLRLQAVTTATFARLHELDSLVDLNGQCEDLALAPLAWGKAEAERLSVLAGCAPQEWVDTGDRQPALALVADEAQVALLYGTDPAISHHALVPLEDPDRILPEGRLAVVADPDGLPPEARGAVSEVMQRLDGAQLAELQSLLEGPDPLTPEEAAQYWLVQNGLETRPEGWF
ncbi:glycine betaine ABC transporter substrate-binding protein [Micrococcus terreus]|uniref:glycine betaine ABC transporter substrate-binding protein n=1 Tax=Micrococcus terreus TaxID=574650 RepID=UPI003018B639